MNTISVGKLKNLVTMVNACIVYNENTYWTWEWRAEWHLCNANVTIE